MIDAGTDRARRIEAPAPVGRIVLTTAGEELCGLLADLRLVRWSAADGRRLHEATYRGPKAIAVAISPSGDQVAVASPDGAVRLLDTTTLTATAEMRRPPAARVGLAFSPDAKLLARFVRGRHPELTVWNARTGAPVSSFVDQLQESSGIAFHPSGRTAALAVMTGDVLVLDLLPGRTIRTLSDAKMTSEALSFSSDGRALLAASYDGVLQVWGTESGSVRRLPGLSGADALAVSPDGTRAAVSRSSYNPGDAPAEARLLDLRAGTMIRSASPGIASTADVAFTASGAARMAAARGTEITVQELG
jgi:WD40 repeat protein